MVIHGQHGMEDSFPGMPSNQSLLSRVHNKYIYLQNLTIAKSRSHALLDSPRQAAYVLNGMKVLILNAFPFLQV